MPSTPNRAEGAGEEKHTLYAPATVTPVSKNNALPSHASQVHGLVTMARRKHPFPSRTRSLRVSAAMVLHFRVRESSSLPALSYQHRNTPQRVRKGVKAGFCAFWEKVPPPNPPPLRPAAPSPAANTTEHGGDRPLHGKCSAMDVKYVRQRSAARAAARPPGVSGRSQWRATGLWSRPRFS